LIKMYVGTCLKFFDHICAHVDVPKMMVRM
jgi:hypothetical protein